MAKAYLTEDTARRVVAATRVVEGMAVDRGAVRSAYRGDEGTEIVRGTFTPPWEKLATRTVTSALETGVTYEAKNWFADISGTTGSKNCAIAFVGGEWILIAAEC